MANQLDVVNMALGFVGSRGLASMSEATPEAQPCRLFWDTARRVVLRSFPWSFAQTRTALSYKELPDEWEDVWTYAYGVPEKCVKVNRVSRLGMDREEPFEMVQCSDGKEYILTNVPDAYCTYTMDTEELSRADEHFVICLAYKLACLIVVPLYGNNSSKVTELQQLYQQSVPDAQGVEASEGRDKKKVDSWLASRGGWDD